MQSGRDNLDDCVTAEMQAHGIPGVSLAIVRERRIVVVPVVRACRWGGEGGETGDAFPGGVGQQVGNCAGSAAAGGAGASFHWMRM